jgi:hypothetical protein
LIIDADISHYAIIYWCHYWLITPHWCRHFDIDYWYFTLLFRHWCHYAIIDIDIDYWLLLIIDSLHYIRLRH